VRGPDTAGGWRSLRAAAGSREGVILIAALVALVALGTAGRPATFVRWFGHEQTTGTFAGLLPFVWSAGASVVTRLVFPLAVMIAILREPVRSFGFGLPRERAAWLPYAALYGVMVPVIWAAAGTDAFQRKYPLWDGASASWAALAVYELRYFFIFLSGEAFWRGFMVCGLGRRFGAQAISISMLPYVCIHFGKPPAETLGAIVTAYVLGALALRHRSFWPGVVLHYAVALSMDLFALARGDGFPPV
jgi:hypothetical protein